MVINNPVLDHLLVYDVSHGICLKECAKLDENSSCRQGIVMFSSNLSALHVRMCVDTDCNYSGISQVVRIVKKGQSSCVGLPEMAGVEQFGAKTYEAAWLADLRNGKEPVDVFGKRGGRR